MDPVSPGGLALTYNFMGSNMSTYGQLCTLLIAPELDLLII